MRGSRKFCQRGSNIVFYKEKRIQIALKAGHHRPVSEMPFKWRFAGGPMGANHWMLAWQLCDFQGIWTSIAKKPYIFVIYQGRVWTRSPPLWIRTWTVAKCSLYGFSRFCKGSFFLCKVDLVSNMRVKESKLLKSIWLLFRWYNMLNIRTYIFKQCI